jgi:hypothetical protein
VKVKATSCGVPEEVTAALEPGALVIVLATVIVAAKPLAPGVPGSP